MTYNVLLPDWGMSESSTSALSISQYKLKSLSSWHSHFQDGVYRLHVLVEDRASLGGAGGGLCEPGGVGGPGEDGAHGDDGGLPDAGLGINVSLSVVIHICVVYKSKNAFAFHNTN